LHKVVDDPAVSFEALAWGFHFLKTKQLGDLIIFKWLRAGLEEKNCTPLHKE